MTMTPIRANLPAGLTVLVFAAGILAAPAGLRGADGDKHRAVVATPSGTPVRTYLNINNISTVFTNFGISDIDVQEANSGLVFPKGSRKTAVFASGFLWGGEVNGEVRVGGSAYRTGLQAGRILSPGVAEDPDLPKNRIYRVRPDEPPGPVNANLATEVAEEGQSEDAIRAQYELDWNEWPASEGAPYDDVDGNGSYDPTMDIPGVPGANQTLWYVANDLSTTLTQNLYGSIPMGIEMQTTVWAYSQTGALGNMFFRRYVIINKSTTPFDSMYVSMWSDVDLGNASDDYAGCDTSLSLGYCYNAQASDATYSPLPPPAVGFDFFQGPIVAGEPADSGIFNGEVVYGKKNLPMTAYYYFARGDASVTDPTQGSYEGTTQFYNFFQGKIGRTGETFTDPNTGDPTTYALAGDPQTRTGWLDGQLLPAGDRRIGLASGPFTMSAGDTQEVVIAEIVAGATEGVDRLSAIGLLKFYDLQAQLAYDNFFDLPTAPPAPNVTVTALDREIVLDWSKDETRVGETESSSQKGFTFQGYNIYQLPSSASTLAEATRVATFDVNDGIGKISDLVFDPKTGSVVEVPVQFGNDTDIKRYISITQDVIKQRELINGIRYYYAVTSYNYNPDPDAVPNNIENPLQIFSVTPQTNNPGVSYGGDHGGDIPTTHSGTADGGPVVNIVDPAALTGNTYEIFFTERAEIRDSLGNWVPSSVIERKTQRGVSGADTVTGSSIDIAGVYAIAPGQIQLHCVFTLVSSNAAWVDGITMTMPAGVTIVEAPGFDAGGGPVSPVVTGNTISMGLVNHEYTENGLFHGDEEWDIIVSGSAPMAIDWTIFDDGYLGTPVDETGTTNVTTIGNLSRTAKYWNLRDSTSGEIELTNQGVINGIDLYPPRDDVPTNPGNSAAPVVDGFQTYLNINYAAPQTFFLVERNGEPLPTVEGTAGAAGQRWLDDDFAYTDFTFFGIVPGTSNAANGYGSTAVDDLQQDYEFRWTGVEADTVIAGQTIKITKSGGSIATMYGARQWSIANHPLNPNPGSTAPFLIRIPFEVWNVDKGIQINYQFYDRSQTSGAANPFYVWYTLNRTYGEVLDTPYDPAHIANQGGTDGPDYTWTTVWYESHWTQGDVIKVSFVNPIQPGVDEFTFTTTAPGYSQSLAASQVDQINVFPNPYYAVNTEELNKYQRFVTFSHLPDRATIRIFNLAGVLVRTIEKTAAGQYERWDLANDAGLPVASGLYIAYIDMPEVGTTKILKLSVIQEQQILDRY